METAHQYSDAEAALSQVSQFSLFILSISLMYCHDGFVSVPSDYLSLIPFNSV